MNKRQRKKVEDKLLIRLRKLHPGKGDFIFVEMCIRDRYSEVIYGNESDEDLEAMDKKRYVYPM